MSDEFEIRADGVRARKDRWEVGIRRIVALLWGNRHAFEVDEDVEAVRALIPEPKLDDEGLVQAVLGMPVAASQPAQPGLLEWAVSRWHAEVMNRPLVNVHRRSLDDTWRQVVRFAGGDPDSLLGPDHSTLLAASPLQPAPVALRLDDIEQYRMQMAGISTAASGYWKEGDGVHPDYDTLALRDVAKLYAKYDRLYKAAQPTDEDIHEALMRADPKAKRLPPGMLVFAREVLALRS